MTTSAAIPIGKLTVIGAVVVIAHIALLLGSPGELHPPQPSASRAFTTRQIAAAPERPVAPPAEAKPAPRPAPAAAPRPREAASAPQVTDASSQQEEAPQLTAISPQPETPVQPDPPSVATEPEPLAQAAAEASLGPTPEPVSAAPPAAAASPPTAAPPQPTRPGAVQIPQPATLRYEVRIQARGLAVGGDAELAWRHDGRSYEAQLQVTGPLLPTRMQRSTGDLTAQGLAPRRFSDRYRSETATHFQRDKGVVIFSTNQPQAAMIDGVQDRLSVVMQLAAMVAGEPHRYVAGSAVVIATASTREQDTWVFTVEGEEDLQLPGGSLRAIKLQRVPRKQYDQKLELWLAPRMDYAPVRLRLTHPNGDTLDQRWSSTDRS